MGDGSPDERTEDRVCVVRLAKSIAASTCRFGASRAIHQPASITTTDANSRFFFRDSSPTRRSFEQSFGWSSGVTFSAGDAVCLLVCFAPKAIESLNLDRCSVSDCAFGRQPGVDFLLRREVSLGHRKSRATSATTGAIPATARPAS